MSKNKKITKKVAPKKVINKKADKKSVKKIDKKVTKKIEKKAVAKKDTVKKIVFSNVAYSSILENYVTESMHLNGLFDRSEAMNFDMLVMYQLNLSYIDDGKTELSSFIEKKQTLESAKKLVKHITNFYSVKAYKNLIHNSVKTFVNSIKKEIEKMESETAKQKKVA